MSLVQRLLPDNPMLTKELRVRMRGARGYWILFGYLGFLSLVMLLRYAAWKNSVRGGGLSDAAHFGEEMFINIVVTQVFLVLFITPAITSGSLTIEREQQTMDMLTMTRLSRRSIVTGKILSAVAFTALLLTSSLPLVSICFMLGSVDPAMVLSNYMMLLMGSFLIGALGLMWSSIAKTTTQAVLYTYATLFFLLWFGAGSLAAQRQGIKAGDLVSGLFYSLGVTWFGDTFYGLKSLEGIGFGVFCILAGILLCAVAISKLEMWPERQGRTLRRLTLLLIGVEVFAINLFWLRDLYAPAVPGVQKVANSAISVLIALELLVLLAIPAFATGELLPGEARNYWKYLRAGWNRKGMGRGKMHSGLPFLLVLTTFGLLLYAFTFIITGHASDITHSAFPVGFPSVVSDTARQTLEAKGIPSMALGNGQLLLKPAGDFWQAAIALYATVIGFALFCYFLSVSFRSRWIAWLVASLLLLVIFVAPEIARNNDDISKIGPSINLFVLNPVQALVQMNDPGGYWNHRPLLFGKAPMWELTTIAWMVIGVLSLVLTGPFVKRIRTTTPEIPYEEMIAEA